MSQLHYPEEWGPSNDRKLTCSCGHPDPAHRDPKAPTPTDAAACKWETYPGRERFRVWKEDPENAHSAWFVVFPGPHGTSLAINHNNDDTVDEARANWIAHALNTALAAPAPEASAWCPRGCAPGVCGAALRTEVCARRHQPTPAVAPSEALNVRELLEHIVSYSAGWDEHGSTGPRHPFTWETVGRVALDLARAALATPTEAPASALGAPASPSRSPLQPAVSAAIVGAGSWHATTDGRWVNSDWFDLDASLKVTGDFPDESARIAFADDIARRLNASADADGEALRLAVQHNLTLRFYFGNACAQATTPGGPSAYEDVNNPSDPMAGARLAISRAVAVIARGAQAAPTTGEQAIEDKERLRREWAEFAEGRMG